MAADSNHEADTFGLVPDTTIGATPRHLEEYVGGEVRRRRQDAKLTIEELAERAGLSGGMLSRIEYGITSPTIRTLAAIAEALGLPLSGLFAPLDQVRDVSFVPAGGGMQGDRGHGFASHVYSLLGRGVGGPIGVEPYLITLADDSDTFADFQHEGAEAIYMLAGEVLYRHGNRCYHMTAGDFLLFDSMGSHGPVEPIALPVRYLAIIAYKRAEVPSDEPQ